MEEKERYYSLIDNNGNFELRDYECGKTIHSLFELDDLLNQQDKRIKELEEEIQQLKQSQKQLAFNELEKIYNLFEPYENSLKDTILCANNGISFIDYLESKIKELGGK